MVAAEKIAVAQKNSNTVASRQAASLTENSLSNQTKHCFLNLFRIVAFFFILQPFVVIDNQSKLVIKLDFPRMNS